MQRRTIIIGTAGVLGAAALFGGWRILPWRGGAGEGTSTNDEVFEVARTEAEWRAQLTDIQYAVLREEGTERAFTSPLNNEKRQGTYHCAGCDLAVYSSKAKFESGTGWPSFYESLPGAVHTRPDNSFLMTRTEVHCRRCGGHFGHIFDDGPPPTGKRHCINGVALEFRPA